jgi:hypothetical protein
MLWDGTQSLDLARKELYHMSYDPSPFDLILLLRKSLAALSRVTVNSASQIAEVAGMHHHAWLRFIARLFPDLAKNSYKNGL